jgi:hypothetical protein
MSDALRKKERHIDPPAQFGAVFAAQLTKGIDIVDPLEFAGGVTQEMATLPQIRVGKKWFTTAQILTVLVPLGFAGGIPALQTQDRRSGRESGRDLLRRTPGDAEVRTDYATLLHPRLVGYCQVGWCSCLGDYENRASQA